MSERRDISTGQKYAVRAVTAHRDSLETRCNLSTWGQQPSTLPRNPEGSHQRLWKAKVFHMWTGNFLPMSFAGPPLTRG